MARRKTIITAAAHTPAMSDAPPCTADDIASQAAEAGLAILHLHARQPENGGVCIDSDHCAAFLPCIKQATNAVAKISTGGSLHTAIEERIAPALRFSPEMRSRDIGSTDVSLQWLAKRQETWKSDWERDHVASSEGEIFRNAFAEMR